MKILVLLLSLLFSVSELKAVEYDPNKKLRAVRSSNNLEKVCSMYDRFAIYESSAKDRECRIILNNKSLCYSVFKTKQKGEFCEVSTEKLIQAADHCLNFGVSCPKEMPNSIDEEICEKEYVARKDCTQNKNEELIAALPFILQYVQANNKSQCGNIEKKTKVLIAENTSKIASCSDKASSCPYFCSKKRCDSYKQQQESLKQARVSLMAIFNGSEVCRQQVSDSTNQYTASLILDDKLTGYLKDKGVQVSDSLNDQAEHNTPTQTAAINSSVAGDQQSSEESAKGKTTPHAVHGKFNANTNYVKDTFNKLDQKMADRLNQGKTTKEDRKPNNTIASVSNDNSLPNKNKSNKYLVASSNDSFLTKKDIFKTVSNAYYKMCQTDSCYGIVKK